MIARRGGRQSAAPTAIEAPGYPAALADVIAVGSHDGQGVPSEFSQNGPGVDVLADGEHVPGSGPGGTSFAAPQVAATVTHVQAIVAWPDRPQLLDVAQMIDVLQRGGRRPPLAARPGRRPPATSCTTTRARSTMPGTTTAGRRPARSNMSPATAT